MDAFLKVEKSKNEKIVEKIIAGFDGNNSLEILNKLKDETYNKKFAHNPNNITTIGDIYIWSHFPTESDDFKNKIMTKIVKNNADIIHVNLDRSIRDMIYDANQLGKLNKIEDNNFKLDSINLPEQPYKDCFPTEHLYIVRVNPACLL